MNVNTCVESQKKAGFWFLAILFVPLPASLLLLSLPALYWCDVQRLPSMRWWLDRGEAQGIMGALQLCSFAAPWLRTTGWCLSQVRGVVRGVVGGGQVYGSMVVCNFFNDTAALSV